MNQTEIENMYARGNIREMVKADVHEDSPVIELMIRAIDAYRSKPYTYESKQKRINALTMESKDIALELIILVLTVKEMSPIQSIAAQLGARMGYTDILDAVKTASEIIAVAEISGAYTLHHSQDIENETGTLGIKPNYTLETETQDFINRTKYLPPIVEKPLDWYNNTDGGYLTQHSSVILGSMNHHNDVQSLDVINLLQGIKWQLNDMVEYLEVPNKDLDTPEKLQQFNDMQHQSTRVYKELLEHGNEFYFVWKYDKRGRMYSQGYHCNLQGTEYKKAILSFAKEELIV